MIRVVLDTNIYISALMFGGLPSSLLDLALLQSFLLVVSPALLDELDEKFRLKFEVPAEDTAIIRAKLESVAEIVRPDMVLHVIADDPDDNRVLECAVKGSADYIVTGDRHLLKLGSYDGKAVPGRGRGRGRSMNVQKQQTEQRRTLTLGGVLPVLQECVASPDAAGG